MKLYFKDLSYETKYKWLSFICEKNVAEVASAIYNEADREFSLGYIDLNDYKKDYYKQIKALNIWKEPLNKEKIEKITYNSKYIYNGQFEEVKGKINEIIERVNQIVEIIDLNELRGINE